MDWSERISVGISWLKKYRYALMVILAGISLLTFSQPEQPQNTVPETVSEQMQRPDLEVSLEKILSRIEGVGEVDLLLTVVRSEETVYQTDDIISTGTQTEDIRKETVLITGENRLETGLIHHVNFPVYRGAVVICQGADDAKVRLAVVDAVMRATDLSSDKITVLKMK